ncbi:exodeoxyribonuclease X C-terminal domain-containing protein [Niameybacter massiliensis]|uniref:exodeoxyribonuclease X C-terminal domain-containing protein n=1 Tax=Niameybacter massiliensis TaxID=1658108 RepID=UPI0006B3FA47|nr:hypothetical protein [Niameybacter massiliensis]
MATHIIANSTKDISLIDEMDVSLIKQTMDKIAAFQAVVQQTLRREHDYGVIPGTLKPTLLKPGGEKICMMLGVNPEYEMMDHVQDYERGFFAYIIRCTLKKGTKNVAQGLGNCNSYEKKYRWINSDYIPAGIESEKVRQFIDKYGRLKYKIPNPDPWDLSNTILKIAKKRAFIDAVLQVASLSEIFTQDLEEMQDFIKQEELISAELMPPKEAAAIKINFGKYKNRTLKEIYKEDPKYFEWIALNSKDEMIKKACEVMKEAAQIKEVQE